MPAIVVTHWAWRWVVLALALAAIIKAFAGWLGGGPFTTLDRRLGGLYAVSLDIQVLLGLILWIGEGRWQPLVTRAMADSQTRFFAFDHPVMMVLALGIAHAGRAVSRRAVGVAAAPPQAVAGEAGEVSRSLRPAAMVTTAHRNAAILYLLSLILIVVSIPWNRALP